MRLTTTTNVSVDGVMQGLGRDDEDRRGGFVRGGWVIPLTGTEEMDHIGQIYAGAALNSRPKYVVSTTLADPHWEGTTVLNADLVASIGNLKARHEGYLLVP